MIQSSSPREERNESLTERVMRYVSLILCAALLVLCGGTRGWGGELELTADERAWLDTLGPIRFSYDPEFAPFEIPNPDGRFVGVAADFLRFLETALEITFVAVPQASWPDSIAAIQDATIDLLPCVGRDGQREAFLSFSDPYLSYARVIVTRKDLKFPGLDLLPGDRIAVQRDSSHHGYIRTATSLTPSLHDTFREAILAVSSGERDAAIGNLATVTHYIQNLSLTNLKIAGRIGEDTFSLHVAVRRGLEPLVPLLNRALAAMPHDRRNQILDYWIPLPQEASPELQLTRAEREWLLANPRIRVGWDPDWAPVEFLAEDGVARGFSVDLMRELQSRLGVRFAYEPPRPWPETLRMLQERQIDVVSCIGPVAERDHFVNLSDTYLTAPVVLYTRPDYPYIRTLADLANRTVAVPAGYAEAQWMDADYPAIRQLYVASVTEGLRAVHEGRAVAFAGSVMQGNYYLSRMRSWPLVISGETGYQNDMRIGVRSDWPIFVTILNKALLSIPEAEKTAFYRRWVLLEYRHRVDFWLVLKVALTGGLGVLLFVFWNRRLAREVNLRSAAEQKANQSRGALEQSYAALQELERQKDNLMHMIVHDMRNPMTVICGALDMLRTMLSSDADRSGELQEIAGIAAAGAEEVNRIVDTLLDVSRMEAGKMPLAKARGSLCKTAEKAVQGLSALAQRSGIAVTLDGDADDCTCDHALMQRVFANLVSNAIKACSRGDHIAVTTCRNGVSVRAEVADTGKGIDPRYHALIFEKFAQVGDDAARGSASSGIGLAFCRLAVEAHGGRIGLESRVGSGSRFWFEIPV